MVAIFVLLFSSVVLLAQQAGTIKDGMSMVSERFGVNFAYDSRLPVDVPLSRSDFVKTDLSRSLDALFEGTGIVWSMKGNYILLFESKPAGPLESFAILEGSSVQMDTLMPSFIIGDLDTRKTMMLGSINADIERVYSVVSPLGEGDPIRWVQTLPGVSPGADGTSTVYIRGGNMGNNLFTLDGVPVYGYSHILGLTTIVPQSIIRDVTLSKGGFKGQENNYTSAHLDISTKLPEAGNRTSVSLNNFLLGVESDGRFRNGLSYIVSVRLSPLMWEYKAFKSMLQDGFNGIEDFGAAIGDVYSKFSWDLNNGGRIDVSGLGSLDNYSFSLDGSSYETMGWKNCIGLIRWYQPVGRSEISLSASINSYKSRQEQDKVFRGRENHLSLSSGLLESSFDADCRTSLNRRLNIEYGLKARYGIFTPGQVSSVVNRTDILLADAFAQVEYMIPERLQINSFLRYDLFKNLRDSSLGSDPEAGLSFRWDIVSHFALEGTIDKLVQYYHTLEGFPLGWSLDLLVPSGVNVAPESSLQKSLGLSFDFDNLSFSIGGFNKTMENLVYYKYSPALFSGALASWENDVDFGRGNSFGAEFSLEYRGNEFYSNVSYTLSDTSREGFESINDGAPFHARFDRRHVLNAAAQWRGLSLAFTFQSGHWENGAAETYTLLIPGASYTANYYSGVNNYHMPNVLRLDAGYHFSFRTGIAKHDVNLGVFNVTNHFNPFMLYFDSASETWNEIALLPFLPNFSYKLCF